MFLHNFKYALKGLIRERTGVFWACLFPFILGTLFNVSFGHIYEKTEQFHEIAVGVVAQEDTPANNIFREVTSQIEDEDGTKMFKVTELSEKKAEKMLEDESIVGYYVLGDEITLHIRENGMDQTILSVFLDNFSQQAQILTETAQNNPSKIAEVSRILNEEHTFYDAVNESKGNMDNLVQYFYSLIAMSCLFGCFLSENRIMKLQADMSAVGMRRGVAPTKKSVCILTEFLACMLVQMVIGCLLLAYLILVCKISLGGRVLYMVPVIAVGSAFGVALGIFAGSIRGLSEGGKVVLTLGVSLTMSFFSGLMVNGIKQLIEDHIPILNRLNPAALITDALYSLNVFDSLNRYYKNLAILSILTALLCIGSIMQIRRTQYAGI